ncbi:hypothetical protein AVEN_193103-1 [Araneus ventricosus]|uniref:Uncharacterized protein n=1 Tax=Araneus ventricosus TaxID=182803 RepID=A0A4Y2B2Y5_ARAVE|nr:hypothetical protein AVEN_193103-1 [Araneus ventricosus]
MTKAPDTLLETSPLLQCDEIGCGQIYCTWKISGDFGYRTFSWNRVDHGILDNGKESYQTRAPDTLFETSPLHKCDEIGCGQIYCTWKISGDFGYRIVME